MMRQYKNTCIQPIINIKGLAYETICATSSEGEGMNTLEKHVFTKYDDSLIMPNKVINNLEL